jgi:RecJ-like exonuclease
MGVNRLDIVAGVPGRAIVLDHHIGESAGDGGVTVINCRDWGVNGSDEACGATLAFLLAIAIDNRNWDTFDMALVGMMADRQHMGGLKGLNMELASLALKRGAVDARRRLRLMDLPLEESLVETFEPLFRKFYSGEVQPAAFLSEMGLDPRMKVSELDMESTQRLGSALVVELLEQGVRPEQAQDVVVRGFTSARYPGSIEELSHIVNSCGRMGEMGVGMAACLGSAGAIRRGVTLRQEYRTGIKEGLSHIIAGEYTDGTNIQHFATSGDERAGALAGLAMMFLLDPERPVISYARVGDVYKISGRGSAYLVETKGLDLAAALREASSAVGGRGGGHPVASGASVPSGSLEEFLSIVDRMVGEQFGERAGGDS